MILELGTLTRTPIFFPMTFLSFFKKFFDSYKKSVYCLNNYCYIFDLSLVSLSLEETDSLLFIFVLKKFYYSILHTN